MYLAAKNGRNKQLDEPTRNRILNLPIEELYERLRAVPAGLSAKEAEIRLALYGSNELVRQRVIPAWLTYLKLFTNPLVLVLITAGVVSAFLGEPNGAIMIGAIVILSVTLQFFQEYRSEQITRQLSRQVAVTATALRDGSWIEIPMKDLVPGDIIRLGVGDIVPADARVLSAKDFFVDQSTLTGESLPVEKVPCNVPENRRSLPDMNHVVFFGTNVISGAATALVVETNGRTEFGRLAKSLSVERPRTEFQKGIGDFTSFLIRVVGVLVIAIFGLNVWRHHDILGSLLFAVAISVGLTPELLPLIITINLSAGAAAMARKKVIVKRLQAIQNLGSMNILCTDKTGTLTEGKIVLHNHIDITGEASEHVFDLARLNSLFQESLKNPMDAAIMVHSRDHGRDMTAAEGYVKVDEIPFDFSRRRVSVIMEKDGKRILVTKGAPESIIMACRAVELHGAISEMTPQLRGKACELFTRLSDDGYRAVAVAYRYVSNGRTVYSADDETDLILAGYISFIDPPKESAGESLRLLKDLGVEVKILTGDNELVTQRICERVGLEVAGTVMGSEIDNLTDDELASRVMRATICARLSPEQKNRVISVLKKAGQVVGYMGDGINDSMSLRTADVGISVNNAVDVAKEAADIVLLEEGLHILKEGILEGRRTFANTMKYLMMGTSSNFGNMISLPIASFMVPFLPMLPTQILLNNLLYDFSQVSIPADQVDEDYMERPRRWDVNFIRDFMIIFGPISSLYDIMTYLVMLKVFHAGASLFQTGWFVESLATQVLVVHIIRSRHSIFKSRASAMLWVTTLATVGLGIVIAYTPIGAFFSFTPLPSTFFLVLTTMVGSYLLMIDRVKRWFYTRFGY